MLIPQNKEHQEVFQPKSLIINYLDPQEILPFQVFEPQQMLPHENLNFWFLFY